MTDTTSSSSTSERAALVREARAESREWATFADLAQTMGALVAERETGTIDIAGTADLLHRLATALEAADADARRMRKAIDAACAIIEVGDTRLLASDGPAGNQPPDISLREWRTMYVALDHARAAEEPTR